MNKKLTISEKVNLAKNELAKMTLAELKAWAFSNKMDNRVAFPRFKKALLEIGINYAAIRSRQIAAENKEFGKKAKHCITLFVDAKASTERFAVANEKGVGVWYGRFYDAVGEQSAAELDAAKKAIWLASKVKAENDLEALKVVLKVDAQWLCWANESVEGYTKRGGKAKCLAFMAKKHDLVLKVEWISGVNNPADKYTTIRGYQNWSDGIADIAINEL